MHHSGVWAQVVSDRSPHPVSLAGWLAGICSWSNSFSQSWKQLSLSQFWPFYEGVTHSGSHARISGLEKRAIRPGLNSGAACLSLEWYYWLVFVCWFKARSLDLLLGAQRCFLFCSLWFHPSSINVQMKHVRWTRSFWKICVVWPYCVPDWSESCCTPAAAIDSCYQSDLSGENVRRS